MAYTHHALVLLALLGFSGCQSQRGTWRREGLDAFQRGEMTLAQDRFDRLLQLDPADPQANFYAGQICQKEGRLETALFHYKMTWSFDPNFEPVKDAMVSTLMAKGKVDEALDLIERDAGFDFRGLLRLRIARAYLKEGDLDNAEKYFSEALRQAPENREFLQEIGGFYQRIGNKKRAEEMLGRLSKLPPLKP